MYKNSRARSKRATSERKFILYSCNKSLRKRITPDACGGYRSTFTFSVQQLNCPAPARRRIGFPYSHRETTRYLNNGYPPTSRGLRGYCPLIKASKCGTKRTSVNPVDFLYPSRQLAFSAPSLLPQLLSILRSLFVNFAKQQGSRRLAAVCQRNY